LWLYQFTMSNVPIAHLESLKFKATQIIESIQSLQRLLALSGPNQNQNYMPAWPDILSKYNILLSQSHNFSTALLGSNVGATAFGASSSGRGDSKKANVYERLAIHPIHGGITDAQLENDVMSLLRTTQTNDVLKWENDCVRRLSEHMETRGCLGVLAPTSISATAPTKKPDYADVLAECAAIISEHDHRIERAIRAVAMLREKFDWKQRVEVEVEEPEELDWDPRLSHMSPHGEDAGRNETMNGAMVGMETPHGSESSHDEVEEELVTMDESGTGHVAPEAAREANDDG
jgi:hypothetical protein